MKKKEERLANLMEGYCAATSLSRSSRCQRGSSGAWPLRETTDLKAASEECLRQCTRCAQCRYFSVSTKYGDCSWFARCDMSRLERAVSGFVTFAANASIGSSVDGRNKALQRRRRRAERHRAVVNEVGVSLQEGKVSDEDLRQQHWRQGQGELVLALGVLSVDTKEEAARRAYIRQTLRPLGRSGLVYKFVIGTRGAEAPPFAQEAIPQAGATRRLELSREHARQGDLALLTGARDGSKAYTSEKVLLWLLHARREYPTALFVGKADPDAFIVWPRLRSLLETAYAARGRTQLLVGYLEWVSYLPDEGRFCGCCGYSREHATMLQLARANFGPCAKQRDQLARVAGPFAYPQGAFYALTAGLLDWVGARAHGLLRRLRDGSLSFKRSEEDLLVGYVAALAPNLTAYSWGKTVYHDFDSGTNPSDYYAIEHECLSRYNVSMEQLVSGTPSEWGTAEVLGPMSAVVHRVNSRAQWRRAWALAKIWSRLSHREGRPECFFPQEELRSVRSAATLARRAELFLPGT